MTKTSIVLAATAALAVAAAVTLPRAPVVDATPVSVVALDGCLSCGRQLQALGGDALLQGPLVAMDEPDWGPTSALPIDCVPIVAAGCINDSLDSVGPNGAIRPQALDHRHRDRTPLLGGLM
jgi:hypothetical protein